MKSYNFPPLYAGWIEQMTGSVIPDETRATCSDCPMCKPPEPATERDRVFLQSTKCCTYSPVLPNFLVGGILLDEDPAFAEGKALFQREGQLLYISPGGIEPHWQYWWHYNNHLFGESQTLRCPYYIDRDGGLCGIWKFRNSRCTTWFCKYERGAFGRYFWQALSNLLAATEKVLSAWCVSELKVQIPDGAETYAQKVWGNWEGRERQFYENCYVLVSKLTWNRVMELTGPATVALHESMMKAFREMKDDSIPSNLIAGEFTAEELGNDMVRLWGYARYDPIDVSRSVLEKISNFKGNAADFDDGLLRILYERQILKAL